MPGDRNPFPAGTSANPGGRPKKTPAMREAEELARERSPDAMRRLVSIATESEDEHAAIKAANAILDRALGKPRVEVSGPDGDPLAVQLVGSEDALAELQRRLSRLAPAGDAGGDPGGPPAGDG